MLTKQQKKKVNLMVSNYETGLLKTSNASRHIIKAWAQRYRIAMEQELMKQDKH